MLCTEKLFSLIPLAEIEYSAQEQIFAALKLDFMLKLAIMPDIHMGYSLPIGGVALLDNVISPAYVGYDIGCGMCSFNTGIAARDLDESEKVKIFYEIYDRVPVGFDGHTEYEDRLVFESASGSAELNEKVGRRLNSQLGTLGSGNHFIEIGKNRDGEVVITIHSGSRNIGHSIAGHYMKIQGINKTEAGFLSLDSVDGANYWADMNFALNYALKNRVAMMEAVCDILGVRLSFATMINENHNHAELTNEGVLHRKGATPAENGQLGVIPGNMRDGVYITRGLGNETFLNSASHGAGRKLGRNKAKKSLDVERFMDQMEKADIIAKVGTSTLDEAPDAYKNLDKVISYQEGIVIDVVDRVIPLINVKG
tara:strand:+ start:4887 stop:5990 length:1104 start_codon:yes stop_codon:yes gene_type:complete